VLYTFAHSHTLSPRAVHLDHARSQFSANVSSRRSTPQSHTLLPDFSITLTAELCYPAHEIYTELALIPHSVLTSVATPSILLNSDSLVSGELVPAIRDPWASNAATRTAIHRQVQVQVQVRHAFLVDEPVNDMCCVRHALGYRNQFVVLVHHYAPHMDSAFSTMSFAVVGIAPLGMTSTCAMFLRTAVLEPESNRSLHPFPTASTHSSDPPSRGSPGS